MNKILQSIIILIFLSCNSNESDIANEKFYSDLLAVKLNYKDTTVIYPHLNGLIQPSQNSIYCSSFEIAWNKIRDEILKEPIILEKQIEWVDYLNDQEDNSSIDDKYLVSYAGFGKVK